MSAEKIIGAFIRSEIMMPRYLIFKGELETEEEKEEE